MPDYAAAVAQGDDAPSTPVDDAPSAPGDDTPATSNYADAPMITDVEDPVISSDDATLILVGAAPAIPGEGHGR